MRKGCFKCGETLPISEFYRHPQMADEHLNKCKKCTKKDVTTHREIHIDEIREYDRKRGSLPHRIILATRATKKWRQRYPERKLAQSQLSYAIKSGALTAWPLCAIPECNTKPEAHHPDYAQPFAVVWLCSAHHKQAHALIGKP